MYVYTTTHAHITYSGVGSGAVVCVVLYVLLFRPCLKEGAGGREKTVS